MGGEARTLPKGAVRALKRRSRAMRLLETPPVQPHEEPARASPAAPSFRWEPVGHIEAKRFLTADDVERIHATLVEDFARDADPIVPAGVRSRDLLESAVHRQHTSSGAELKYPTAVMVAGALLHSLVLNHAFFNGNKRTALVSMLVVLDENGLMLTNDDKTLFRVVLRVAQHEIVPRDWPDRADREVKWLADWLEDNTRPIEKGERPLQWRKLRHILAEFDCTCSIGSGNRMNITRVATSATRFGRTRRRTMFTQVKYTDEGREAQKHTIHQIRRDLELDEGHGVDSAAFYGDAGRSVDEFIVRYRKTLDRLSKL